MIELSESYLRQKYVVEEKSTYEIAQECNTYPNRVRRALIKYSIPIRTKGEAQLIALKNGRHEHPTKGRCRPPEVKRKISEGVRKTKGEKNGK